MLKRPLIISAWACAHGFAGLIQECQGLALDGEAHGDDLRAVDAGLVEDALEAGPEGAPVGLGALLDDARRGRDQGVLDDIHGDGRPALVEEADLDRRRSQIRSDEVARVLDHGPPSAACAVVQK